VLHSAEYLHITCGELLNPSGHRAAISCVVLCVKAHSLFTALGLLTLEHYTPNKVFVSLRPRFGTVLTDFFHRTRNKLGLHTTGGPA
jgi:hypothetical protein